MPFSLLALIIFLIVYAIIAYGVYSSRKCNTMSGKNICRALPTSTVFFYSHSCNCSQWFHRILYKIILGYSISRIIYHYLHRSYRIFTICVFKDAYFSYSETPVKNIVQSIFLFSLIGGINLYTGIMNQQEIISQHSPVKFNNINLISGILLLLADAIVITRAIMEHLQKEE